MLYPHSALIENAPKKTNTTNRNKAGTIKRAEGATTTKNSRASNTKKCKLISNDPSKKTDTHI